MRDTALIILIIVIITLIFYFEIYQDKNIQVSRVDDRRYKTVKIFEDQHLAADKLAYINEFIIKLMKYLREKYIYKGRGTPYQQAFVKRLLDGYNPDVIQENNPKGIVNTSYVYNKGEEVAFCLREKKTGQNRIHENHILEFVVLHEISHIADLDMSESSHKNEFWQIFKFMLMNAKEAGLHDPTDYTRSPMNYCGLEIEYSPYYDKNL
jgi:hypothetical protein